MAKSTQRKTSRDKVRDHRARLRAQGLRPIQLWVPDTRSLEFARRAHREAMAMAASSGEAEEQAFIDAISEWNET